MVQVDCLVTVRRTRKTSTGGPVRLGRRRGCSGELLFSVLEDDEEELETDKSWTGPSWKGKGIFSMAR